MFNGLDSSLSLEKLSDERKKLLFMGNVEQQVALFSLCTNRLPSICYYAIHNCKDGAKSLFALVYYALNGI